MLKEYSLIPDIFDQTQYSNAALCGVMLNNIKTLILHEGIASNLCDGGWSKYLTANNQRFHRAGIELISAIRKQSRMVKRQRNGATLPITDLDWVNEALSSHATASLDGILVSHTNAQNFAGQNIVSSIESLERCDWWNARSESVRLKRITNDYLQSLNLLLRNANSLIFIDPHLDLAKHGYSEFIQLLTATERGNHNLNPKIEIHRVCYTKSGRDKAIETNEEWEKTFKRVLSPIVKSKELKIEVFIWDDFHDRYLLSNLIGISVPNGFDITTNPNVMTTWTRLSRDTATDVQREFDPASNRHSLIHRFRIV